MSNLIIRNNRISNCGTGIKVRGKFNLDADGNLIEKCEVAFDLIGLDPPSELVQLTVQNLVAAGIQKPTEEELASAAEKSGLKKWALDNGVALGSLLVSIGQWISS